eukprot:Selendium_serpulae@DN6380_c1_g3_i2.p1
MTWTDSAADFTFDGKTAKCTAEPKNSTKFNVLWEKNGVTSGSHYYEVTIKEGDGVWIGLTDKKHFGSGYKLRGMMYGGNTSNGSGLVTKQFGPSINKGDTAGCLYEFNADGDKLVVTFYHNGKCLGPAFDITKKQWFPIFPVVAASKGGEVFEINDEAKKPAKKDREADEGNHGMIGSWKCDEYSMTMNLKGNDEQMNAVAKIINNVSFPLTKEGDKWVAGQPKSTLMAGPPDMTEKEEKFEGIILPNLDYIKLDGKDMVWTYAKKQEIKFQPHVAEAPKASNVDCLGG